ncbi:hypothetical protein ACFQPA_18380 [Halomarina halobia]|uniref:Uncharacterized protein n=1 Tax=Halomarina halobia TaxID=3033386 RepID=A0ABD6ADH0_9EURY|nr:hypothetical protein [Halomarina sp. PSR21]
MGCTFPQLLNTLTVPVFVYGLYAAYTRKPVRTAVCTAAVMALKPWFVAELIDHHEASTAAGG